MHLPITTLKICVPCYPTYLLAPTDLPIVSKLLHINNTILLTIILAFFWSFWPGQTPVDASTMNWGVVMFGGVGILCAIAYALQGRKIYTGPVKNVVGREHEL